MNQLSQAPEVGASTKAQTSLQAVTERVENIKNYQWDLCQRVQSLGDKLSGPIPENAKKDERGRSDGMIGDINLSLDIMDDHNNSMSEALSRLESMI